jgi:FMN-dependent NADH-azoreductase
MPHLLHVDSSADVAASRTRTITRSFVDAWSAQGAEFTVTHRDLHRDPLPHLPDVDLHWAPRLRSGATPPPARAEALQQELLAELFSADVLLVGAPMYNYSLPSSLKAWIDHIHVLGVTASFDAPAQPVAGRPAVIVTSQGMAYEPGTPTAGQDHATPVLELILGGALGMRTTVLLTRYAVAARLPDMAEQAREGEAEFADTVKAADTLARSLAGASVSGPATQETS